MSDLISTDHPLTEEERSIMIELLDTLLPADEALDMPSAADLDFDSYLKAQAADLVPALRDVLAALDSDFGNLTLERRVAAVTDFSANQPELFMTLLARVYDCYYQDDRVRKKIGVVTGAPFPQGNEVASGDLSLLDPVIEQSDSHRYRQP